MLERIQKILSQRGIASRRKAEEYITRGLVKVNGKVATLGQKADPDVDRIEVDGQVLSERQEMLYYVMNKPVGVVTENVSGTEGQEGKGSRTVRDLLPKELQGKVFPVGRLDKDSSGLLLFTNDGVLAYRLTHPKFPHEKEYEVTVDKKMYSGALQKLKEGMSILGTITKRARVQRIDDTTFRIAITEGKNRQIRRMCEKVGYTVTALKRLRIVTLRDERLGFGVTRPLTQEEVATLLKAVGADVGSAQEAPLPPHPFPEKGGAPSPHQPSSAQGGLRPARGERETRKRSTSSDKRRSSGPRYQA